jgi:hypothetical protein
METVLYELHFRWGDLPVLLIPLLVGVGFWAVSCGMSRAKGAGKDLTAPARRDLSHSKGVKWFLRGVAVLCGVVFILSSVAYIADYTDLKTRYEAGDYLTAEGVVEDLTIAEYPRKGGDSFTLDGVTFTYTDTDLTLPGYRREAQNGGVITREGQYLVIRYIPDPDTGINHILYIAEPEAP